MSCGVCASCGGEPFRGTLTYTSPAHGGWGVARMGQLLPESYQLFAGPAACGRHGALSACLQGRKDTIAYLYLSEAATNGPSPTARKSCWPGWKSAAARRG